MLITPRYTKLAFTTLIIIWGTAFPVIKIGLQYSPPLLFSGIRILLGGLCMLIVTLILGQSINLKKSWIPILVSTILNSILFIGLQTYTVSYLSSGLSAVLIYLQPIVVGVLAWIWIGEDLSAAKVTGLILGFLGVIIVSFASFFGENLSSIGIIIGVLTAIVWAIGTVYVKTIQNSVTLPWLISLQFIIGGVILSILGLQIEGWSSISWTPSLWLSLLYLGCIGVAFCWFLWLGLIQSNEATKVSAYTFLIPIISMVVGIIFLNEKATVPLFLGTFVIILGIFLVNYQQSSSPK